MEARAGRPLGPVALLGARIRFLGARSARYVRDRV